MRLYIATGGGEPSEAYQRAIVDLNKLFFKWPYN